MYGSLHHPGHSCRVSELDRLALRKQLVSLQRNFVLDIRNSKALNEENVQGLPFHRFTFKENRLKRNHRMSCEKVTSTSV